MFRVVGNVAAHTTRITVRNADEILKNSKSWKLSNLMPELQARFRNQSLSGKWDRHLLLSKSAFHRKDPPRLWCSVTKREWISNPVFQDHTLGVVFKSHRPAGQFQWICSTPRKENGTECEHGTNSNFTQRSGGDLKTMRLVQSVQLNIPLLGATSSPRFH